VQQNVFFVTVQCHPTSIFGLQPCTKVPA